MGITEMKDFSYFYQVNGSRNKIVEGYIPGKGPNSTLGYRIHLRTYDLTGSLSWILVNR